MKLKLFLIVFLCFPSWTQSAFAAGEQSLTAFGSWSVVTQNSSDRAHYMLMGTSQAESAQYVVNLLLDADHCSAFTVNFLLDSDIINRSLAQLGPGRELKGRFIGDTAATQKEDLSLSTDPLPDYLASYRAYFPFNQMAVTELLAVKGSKLAYELSYLKVEGQYRHHIMPISAEGFSDAIHYALAMCTIQNMVKAPKSNGSHWVNVNVNGAMGLQSKATESPAILVVGYDAPACDRPVMVLQISRPEQDAIPLTSDRFLMSLQVDESLPATRSFYADQHPNSLSFSYLAPKPAEIAQLEQGDAIRIQLLDGQIPNLHATTTTHSFSLAGFTAANRQAHELCTLATTSQLP